MYKWDLVSKSSSQETQRWKQIAIPTHELRVVIFFKVLLKLNTRAEGLGASEINYFPSLGWLLYWTNKQSIAP